MGGGAGRRETDRGLVDEREVWHYTEMVPTVAGIIHVLKYSNAREEPLVTCTLISPHRRQRERTTVPTLPAGTVTFNTRPMSRRQI